eukprot:442890-Rhodomonas_salina.1
MVWCHPGAETPAGSLPPRSPAPRPPPPRPRDLPLIPTQIQTQRPPNGPTTFALLLHIPNPTVITYPEPNGQSFCCPFTETGRHALAGDVWRVECGLGT